jgi:hypothetical protein
MELTERTQQLLDKIDDEVKKAAVIAIFEEDGALYGPATVDVLERVRFAVIKLVMEREGRLEFTKNLYLTDTRDLLMCADFANDLDAHENWCDSVLTGPNA